MHEYGKIVTRNEDIKISLKCLDYFIKICEKNELQYFLAYGTLLGAVRHKGFIPWDDDIDVFMLREDYEKLLLVAAKYETDDYMIHHYKFDKGFYLPWAILADKNTVVTPSRFYSGYLFGTHIDIFPLDACTGKTLEVANKYVSNLYSVYIKSIKKFKPYTINGNEIDQGIQYWVKYCYFIIASLLGDYRSEWRRIEDKLSQYSTNNSVYVVNFFNSETPKIFPTKDFDDFVLLDFEEKLLNAPIGYDDILKIRYGDYMILPPENERVTNHVGRTYYIIKK